MSRVAQHILFWLFYMAFEVYVDFAWMSSVLADRTVPDRLFIAFGSEVLYYLIKLPLTYCSFTIIRRYGMSSRSYFKAAALMVLILALGTFCHRCITVYLILPLLYHEPGAQSITSFSLGISAFLDLVFIVGVANGLKQYRLQVKLNADKEQLMREKLEAELSLLKAQTNPHFLFNTLNNIYALARKNSEKTADVVMRLSKLLRFMLYESNAGLIPLSKEIKVLEDYMELEKLRYTSRLSVRFATNVDQTEIGIAPLILLPLVENAFKHGAGEARFDSFVHICLELDGSMLHFSVENSYVADDAVPENREQMGLRGVRRQLELLYRDHDLVVSRLRDTFVVVLTLDLDSYAAI
jgi:LytS/YehU family sensor histidine kinase